jgi:hypothetical protein
MYVFDGRTHDSTYLGDLTAFNLSSKWFGIFDLIRLFTTYNIQLSDGPRLKT